MKILILLKPILDPSGMMVNRKAGKVFINKKEWMMNPSDARALEAGLRIKDSLNGDAVVIAAAVGDDAAANLLRDAKALGVDRAIQISGKDAPAGRFYAALATHLGDIDLILTGGSALDTGENIGAQIAEHLNFAFVGGAVKCDVENNVARVIRKDDPADHLYNGYECDLPAVVTFSREAPSLRYAHGGDIIIAYRDKNAVETLSADELGLTDLQPLVVERGQSTPPEREFGKRVSIEEVGKMIRN
jgi:electron transfer flavoprotein alpha/beta subunit